ncbi:MAG: hypothetical protein UY05_C0072G0005 [Candidatus Peregrinibacteria bacterium GW2011_GWA2_47_7]|nr:MAG: hypothetical protein UY05_C0072G0005 [Candidatus Peregrinibacteria bacterium GW2011_GWA2_47_7]
MAIDNILQKAKHHLTSFQDKVKNLSQKRAAALQDEPSPHRARSTPKPPEQVELIVSAATAAKIMFIILIMFGAVKFLTFISDILVIFFVALLFSAALDPAVDFLQKRKIPRALAVLILYVVIFSIIGLFISQLIPLLANEIGNLALKLQDLIKNVISGKIELPTFMEGLRPILRDTFEGVDVSQLEGYKDVLLNFAKKLSNVAGSLVNTLIVVFHGLLNAVLVLVLTFLMIIDEAGIDKFILSLFPSRHGTYIMEKNRAIKKKVGDWLRGQITLAISMGVLAYIGLSIIGFLTQPIEFSLTLGMFAAIAEFLPVIGPLLTWLAAVLIVLNQSPVMVIWVTILFIILQQIEGNVLIPVIMRKAVGLSPIFILFGVLVGFKFLGILGIILAVPVTTTVAIFVKDYARREK